MSREKRIRFLQTCLVLLLIFTSQLFSFGMVTVQVNADTISKVYIQPSQYNATNIGETFKIDVKIANVTNLFGYEFKLYYNTTLLDGLSVQIPDNHFLKPIDPSKIFIVRQEVLDNFNDTYGRIWVSMTLLAPENSKTGDGIFATINFKAMALGEPYPLKFDLPTYPYPVKLSTPQATSIPCTAEGAMIKVGVTVTPGQPLIFIDPPTYTATSLYRTFTMNVSIINATNLYGYEYKLFYDKNIVQILSADLPSNHFLKPTDPAKILVQQEVNGDYNSTHGQVWFNITLLSPETAKNGNGVLVMITFKALSKGTTTLHLADTKLSTPPPVTPISHNTKDGQIISNPPIVPAVGRMIDVFTQLIPYGGKGINQSSDAFPPQAEVILYANVTYRGEPVQNKPVAFEISGPPNPYYNFTIPARTIMTNSSGVAMTRFSLPWPSEHPEEIVFGTWFVLTAVEIVGEKVIDTLTFKVGWIVDILSIETIDANLKPKTYFAKATCVGVKLHIRNIAMLPRVATLIVTAFDSSGFSFDSVTINDFGVTPGETYIYAYCFLNVTEEATIGNAMVNSSAYTAPIGNGGLPYCPEASANFVITPRDIAIIGVTTSSIDVIEGQIVNITVTVTNKGNETETFSVSAYYGPFLIKTLPVASLSPNQNRTVTFSWNTTNVSSGSYTISAFASPVPGETERGDNTHINGIVTVRVPGIFIFPRELSLVALIAAAALALFAIALLLARRKRKPPRPVVLMVDVLPSQEES